MMTELLPETRFLEQVFHNRARPGKLDLVSPRRSRNQLIGRVAPWTALRSRHNRPQSAWAAVTDGQRRSDACLAAITALADLADIINHTLYASLGHCRPSRLLLRLFSWRGRTGSRSAPSTRSRPGSTGSIPCNFQRRQAAGHWASATSGWSQDFVLFRQLSRGMMVPLRPEAITRRRGSWA